MLQLFFTRFAHRHRFRYMKAAPFILVCVFFGLTSLSSQKAEAAARNMVTIHGSDTMLILNKELAAVYNRRNTPLKFNVVGGGSELGITALLEGKTDIAATSRAMKESEKAAFEQRTGTRPLEIVIALDAIGVYVHNNNPVTRLTLSQLKGIMTGEIRNWRDVGGLNRRIHFYNRDRNSGTRVFLQEHVLAGKPFSNLALEVSSTAMVAACVARNQGAIGYGGIAYSHGAHIIRLGTNLEEAGVWPSLDNVSSGNYPLNRPLYFYIDPASMNEEMQAFIDWLRSAEWQKIVTHSGYYPASNIDIQKLLPVLKKQPIENLEPILLTPTNMKQHGFDLVVNVSDEPEDLHPGQVKLTVRFSPIGHVIQKIRKLSLRIGEDVTVPVTLGSNFSMEFVVRKSLIGKTSLSLAETSGPQEGAVYIVHLIAFCAEAL